MFCSLIKLLSVCLGLLNSCYYCFCGCLRVIVYSLFVPFVISCCVIAFMVVVYLDWFMVRVWIAWLQVV